MNLFNKFEEHCSFTSPASTRFIPMFLYYTSWIYQKISDFMILTGTAKWEYWPKIIWRDRSRSPIRFWFYLILLWVEEHLGSYQTFMMEPFWENSYAIRQQAGHCFRKEALYIWYGQKYTSGGSYWMQSMKWLIFLSTIWFWRHFTGDLIKVILA